MAPFYAEKESSVLTLNEGPQLELVRGGERLLVTLKGSATLGVYVVPGGTKELVGEGWPEKGIWFFDPAEPQSKNGVLIARHFVEVDNLLCSAAVVRLAESDIFAPRGFQTRKPALGMVKKIEGWEPYLVLVRRIFCFRVRKEFLREEIGYFWQEALRVENTKQLLRQLERSGGDFGRGLALISFAFPELEKEFTQGW